ncbi:MAG: ABC transporter ATP-binding protein [Bosea sp.]|uniref:ABC transporter ATP-binding protein n=1 Tax=Bosea sp. (in: a-proteobacteria) TaxID=1871050 RepID=UPI001AC9E587|nr:ABC transporter ATP-binding protein [Bosea sp. (in: a-proteobacteria)]MBN9451775.1 ABC transporter ATP-binding protein [Bosea sp. (in: a-proteobacteria)]
MNNGYIRVEHLTKRYGDLVVLNDISLDVAEGEFLALLGPSGCGKTTLLRAIAGFVEFSEGDIRIDGRSMKRLPPNRRPVNTVFQNYALFPHLTVAQNVGFGPRRAGKVAAEVASIVEECLSTVGMAAYGERFPAQLSGGQQQRVALARAIANRPKVLLLDEPLGALDLKLRKQMQIELKTLQQKLGITFIFVTHDQEEALVMADRIAVMDAGRIAQIGSGRDIYHAPAERYVADFIGDANLLAATVAADGSLAIGSLSIAARHGAAAGSKATYLLRPEAIRVDHAQDPSADFVSLPACVQEIVFAGGIIRIYAVSSDGQEIVAQQTALAGEAPIAVGDEVVLSWHRDSGRVLTK